MRTIAPGAVTALAVVLLVVSAPRASDKTDVKMMGIVETASADGHFTTLVAALKAADLVEMLKGKGPFTVFAPADEAFEKVGKAKIAELLQDKKALADILSYHVVAGDVTAKDAIQLDGNSAKTVEGARIDVMVKDGTVMINNAKVVRADIACSNGVIHVIDTVLMPPSK